MADKLLLHPKTATQLGLFTDKAPHAILITGARGSGKSAVALELAARLLGISQDKISSHPYFTHIKKPEDKQDIPIESIRGVIAKLKLKAPGAAQVRSVFFIEDAERMSVPAQNALLKVLEEPADGVVFILSAISARNVLPTIASRSQQLSIYPVTLSGAQSFWPNKNIEGSWRLSEGRAGLLAAIVDSAAHPLKKEVEEAKKFLVAPQYERLLKLESLLGSKEQLNLFLDALARTLSALNHSALNKGKLTQTKAIINSRKSIIEAQKALQNNVAPRLVVLNLLLGLKV